MRLASRRPFVLLAVGAVVLMVTLWNVGIILANPHAPTNGGNGTGMSGQCTGDAHDRPTSCHSPHGVGE